MSKKKQDAEKAKPVEAPQVPVPRIIEEHRHCPVCWSGNGGYGVAYSTQGRTRYYKCCKTNNPETGPCGHTWTAVVKLEVIRVEHRVVSVEGQR